MITHIDNSKPPPLHKKPKQAYKINKKTSACTLLKLLFLAAPGHGVSATFPPDIPNPLPTSEINKISGIRAGNRIYSGDIIYQVNELQTYGFRQNTWPNGVIVYDFESGIDQTKQISFEQACKSWTISTPLKCQRRNTEPDYILVKNHNGEECGKQEDVSCSLIGKSPDGGAQDLFIYSKHWDIPSTLKHEIGHAIGMIHEHKRRDRDNYVIIRYDNIRDPEKNKEQFEIDAKSVTYSEYDIESIMHYSNCSFSRDRQNCSPTRPDLQTILPKTCSRDSVGGNEVTQLDLDGVRSAYAASVNSMFNKKRTLACGTHTLNSEQVKLMCGQNCAEASAIIFRNTEELSGHECGGFFIDPNYPEKCTTINKDYVRHWTDIDPSSCFKDGFLANKFEWWVECGCSMQSLPAMCFDYSTGPDQNKVLALLHSKNPQERLIARQFDQVLEWKSKKAIDTSVLGKFTSIVIKNILTPDFNKKTSYLLCNMRIVIEAKRYSHPEYMLPLSLFEKLAASAGVDTSN